MTLEGKCVLVTRPAEEAGSLTSILRERGVRVFEAPTIEIDPVDDSSELDRAVRQLAAGEFAWVSFTSPRAVDVLLGRLHRFGLPPRLPAKVAAVGPATAERLATVGVEVDLMADPHTTAALGEAFPQGSGRVLFPRADIAPEGLEDVLVAKGWTPVRVDAYRTRFLEGLPEDARRALDGDEVDVVVFTSSSTVQGFARMAGATGRACAMCIGPVTADAARRAGFEVCWVAEPHTIDGLVRKLEEVYA
ncbi:MAG: uroporphyrinogen-III synthase [Actinomycetota bacterium]|nr:uroporphyrinogen-III synthase [Actinomycetota bacterium]